MKLEIKKGKFGIKRVLCPKYKKEVFIHKMCQHCSYLTIMEECNDIIKCGWSQQKEDYDNGELIIEESASVLDIGTKIRL